MATSFARDAIDRRSLGSEVSTVPPGSAMATTIASTADPRRARVRRNAAFRATRSDRRSAMLQVLRKRFVLASFPESPVRASTNDAVGTRGGQNPSARSARINATAEDDRSARRLIAPESRTSTVSQSARFPSLVPSDPSRDRLGLRHLTRRGLADLGNQGFEVSIGLREKLPSSKFGADGSLEQLGGR